MSHQDKDCAQTSGNANDLLQALQWLLSGVAWNTILFRKDCTWTPLQLAATALLWAWSDEATLDEQFTSARRIAKHLYQPQQEFAGSWQAFIKMLVRWTQPLAAVLQAALRRRMQESLADSWMLYGFLVFGVDGTRFDVPRTKSHEAVNGPAKKKNGKKVKRNRRRKPRTAAATKKANTPQRWLTLLWHAGTGLPWAWRSGPTGSSEREHCRQMLAELPERALLAADAGFVGYEYLREILDGGRDFLIRVGSNVRLLRKLGYGRESDGTVYLWPDRMARRNERPLILRLIIATGGKHPVYLVTNVGRSRLSDARIVDIYQRRWGIELFFRDVKQTFKRRKLRCGCAANAAVELEWSLLGLWSMGLYAQVEQTQHGLDPARLSVAQVLRAFRGTMRDYLHPPAAGRSLRDLLHQAVRDEYDRRDKTSRDYPRKKRADRPAGPPRITLATAEQVQHARDLPPAAPKGLTA